MLTIKLNLYMKNLLISCLVLLAFFFGLTGFIGNGSTKDKHPTDLRDCLVKTRSKWGDPCKGCDKYRDSYKVWFKNICDDPMDIKVAVQNSNKTWRIFDKENLASGDSVEVFSCEGTGKFLKWVRKAGDREIIFPTNADISKQYPK